MFGNDFYNNLVEKYVLLFGRLFNSIEITRNHTDGTQAQKFMVPIGFGPREKWLARIESDPNLNRAYAQHLPRIGFEIGPIVYDGNRKLGTNLVYKQANPEPNDKTSYTKVYSPVPYNISFKMTIMAKQAEDAHKVMEQIVPYFTPDWVVSAHLLDEMPDYKLDIPLVINSVTYKDEYQSDYKTRRSVGYDIEFTMRAYFFGPVSKAKIIKFAKVNLYTKLDATIPAATIDTQPGMTANGQPTTVLADSISPLLIDENDTYGYIVTITDNV